MLARLCNTQYQASTGVILTSVYQDSDSILLKGEHETEQSVYLKSEEFHEKLEQGELTEILPPPVHRVLNDRQKKVHQRKMLYVQTLCEIVDNSNGELKPSTEEAYERLKAVLIERHPELVYPNMPAKTTINAYWHQWVKNGYDNNVLMPKKRKSSTRLSTESEEFMISRIIKDWCDGVHDNKKACYRAYKDDVKKVNDETIQLASYSTYLRRLKTYSEHYNKLNNDATSDAERNQLLNTIGKRIKTDFPLERVEVDRMCPTLRLIDDDTGEITENMGIYVAMDAYSRYPIGVVVEFGQGENKESVTNLLRSTFESDEFLPAKGRPFELVTDNGAGFNNSIMHKLCNNLAINLKHNPANRPTMKPFVESFNNTLRKQFFEGYQVTLANGERVIGVPGYLPPRTGKEQQSKQPKQLASMFVSDFKKHLNRFLSEYVNTKHSMTGETPQERWDTKAMMRSSKRDNYDHVVSAFHVYLKPSQHKLQASGYITCYNQIFSSKDLKDLYSQMKTYGNELPSVSIQYCPFDARYVTVIGKHPKTKADICLVVPNRELDDMPFPVSFEELNGHKPKSFSVYMQAHKGEVTNQVESVLQTVKVRKKRSGKPVHSYEVNNAANLSAAERIQRSNEKVVNERTEYDANIAVVEDKPKHSETKQRHHQPNDNYDEGAEDLWND